MHCYPKFLLQGSPRRESPLEENLSKMKKALIGGIAFGLVVFLILLALFHIEDKHGLTEILYICGFWGVASFLFAFFNLYDGPAMKLGNPFEKPNTPKNDEFKPVSLQKPVTQPTTQELIERAVSELEKFKTTESSLPAPLPEGFEMNQHALPDLLLHIDGGKQPKLFFTSRGKSVPVLRVTRESRVRWRYQESSTVDGWAWSIENADLVRLVEQSSTKGLVYESVQQAYHAELEERWEFALYSDYIVLTYTSHFDDSP